MISYFENIELKEYFDIDIIFEFDRKILNKIGYDLKNRNIRNEIKLNDDEDKDYEIDMVEKENIINNKLV